MTFNSLLEWGPSGGRVPVAIAAYLDRAGAWKVRGQHERVVLGDGVEYAAPAGPAGVLVLVQAGAEVGFHDLQWCVQEIADERGSVGTRAQPQHRRAGGMTRCAGWRRC